MPVSGKAAFAAGAVFALVISGGGAYAATGGSFILGRSNAAGTTTTLKSAKGPALSLVVPKGTAPLAVSNQHRVPRLNADLVDGKHAGAFASAYAQTGFATGGGVGVTSNSSTPSTAAGNYDDIVAIATCPRGTQLTGGGLDDGTHTGRVVANEPIGSDSWGVAVATDNTTTEDPTTLTAFATCLNPRGSAPKTLTSTSAFRSSGDTSSRFIDHVRAESTGR